MAAWKSYVAAMCLALAAPAAHAQADYPTRTVRIIVPFAAGGPIDVAARMFADALRVPLGQQVIIENRGGGGGVIGTEFAARAEPDGYTLLMGAPGSLVVSPSAKRVSYDVAKDFVPIAQIFRSAQIFAVHPSLGIRTFPEFIAYAKANPAKINIGSAGIGTLPHLSIELLKLETGVDVAHVPYKGTGAAVSDLLGGQIHALFADVAVLKPRVDSGAVIALAVTSPERSVALPNVPTMAEVGHPKLQVEGWGGLLAPAGVPAKVLERLNAALKVAMADPRFRESGAAQAWSEVDPSPEKFRAFLRDEAAKWGHVVKAANIRID